jgi:hypothetical protein
MVAPALIASRASFDAHLRGALLRSELTDIIRRQLEFMQSATKDGRLPLPEEQARIDIGPRAVRNLEETDWELARILEELDYAFRRYELLPP